MTLPRILVLFLVGTLVVQGASAQNSGKTADEGAESRQERPRPELAEKLIAAFVSGSFDRIVAASAERIQIGILGADRRYSRSQARFVLRDFFERYPPAEAGWQEGKGVDDGWFGIASYRTREGDAMLISALIRFEAGSWKLVELTIREAI